VLAICALRNRLYYARQRSVAGGMTVAVVELLEFVDVDHCGAAAHCCRGIAQRAEHAEESMAIRSAGQGVALGGVAVFRAADGKIVVAHSQAMVAFLEHEHRAAEAE